MLSQASEASKSRAPTVCSSFQKIYKKRIEERSGKLPKGQKWFLLNKLFGLLPSEIARMEGLEGSSSVRQLIIRVSDQLQAGEIRLIDATPDESEQATKRLDEKRWKRRERYAGRTQVEY